MRTLPILVMLGAALACNDPKQSQEQADKAQTQADQDKLKSQAEADRKQAEANEALTKAKGAYRSTFTDLIADLDKRAADLQATRMTAKASDFPDIDKKLSNIASLRATIVTDLRSLDTATAAGWDVLKEQFDKDTKACRAWLPLGKT